MTTQPRGYEDFEKQLPETPEQRARRLKKAAKDKASFGKRQPDRHGNDRLKGRTPR
jgi:hypothetical protein